LNSKGGVGKSSIVRALAVRAAQTYTPVGAGDKAVCRVAIGDLDSQATVSDWWAARKTRDVDLLRGVETAGELTDTLLLSPVAYAAVFADTAPSHIFEIEAVIAASDAIVIPTMADRDSLLGSRASLVLALESNKPLVVVLTNIPVRSKVFVEDARAAIAEWTGGAAISKIEIDSRIAWPRAFAVGKSPAEIDKKAAEQVDALWHEVAKKAGLKGAR